MPADEIRSDGIKVLFFENIIQHTSYAIKDARREPLNATTITKGASCTIQFGQKRYCLACSGNHVDEEFVFPIEMFKYLLLMRTSGFLLCNEKLKFNIHHDQLTKGNSF